MTLSEAMSLCHENGIKIYPVGKNRERYVESEIDGKIKRYDKILKTNKQANQAVIESYFYFAKKLEK